MQILGRPEDLQPRVEGLFVARDGFDGWDDSGDARRESVERPAAHGEFDLPAFQGARVFSIDGHALAWSETELAHLRSQVTGLGADGSRLQITVDHQGQTLWAIARRSAKATFRDAGVRHGMLRARFLLQFVAVDPRKYGEVRHYAAGKAALHYGNFPATPRLLIGAGAGGYTVTGPDGRVVTVGTAPAAAHEIDFVTGGLFLNGVRQMGAITVYQPWSIPAGLPGVTASISGARSLTQRVHDTFI
ncbi:hypothetical protein [Microbacterium sp. NPDC087592]|uniref:hypothetical protein n=1 Tax=Microbacterium sp. NPDC087592 TaxID=3364193 RepID=UPI0038058C20